MGELRTLSEIQSTCTKAARGAGCPWGLAQEAGMAARVLHSHGLNAAQTLCALFDIPRSCACDGASAQTKCGIAELAYLADCPPREPIALGPVAAPLLLAAPLLQAAKRGGETWRVDWESGAVLCTAAGITQRGAPAPDIAQRVTITPETKVEPSTPFDWRSKSVDEQTWQRLEGLAARTYVPETDQSCASGAGPDDADTD